ncbi:uncharacterized protein KY384_003175 [Bacidia gigantensis]|uniref:uncharacterized protein n=1 Tax=Bacidia gigantensis TaxID=2732470 RepID=UPI001D048567|nr:uncharacterized protein KY384_003175 [Bacidia gigantensis]KAG8531545.1 hypothetical protein KY384_003175 [Bacidia gigantensis]
MLTTRKCLRPTSLRSSLSALELMAPYHSSKSLVSTRAFWSNAQSQGCCYREAKGRTPSYTSSLHGTRRQHRVQLSGRSRVKLLSGSQFWRSASYWRKPLVLHGKEQTVLENHIEDWWRRWDKQHAKKFEDLAKRLETDPYEALFGASNRCLRWSNEGPDTVRTCRSSEAAEGLRGPWDEAVSQVKHRVNGGTKTPKSAPAELQEYEIDPITLYKVPKAVASTKSKIEPPSRTSESKSNDVPVKKFKSSSANVEPTVPGNIPSTQSDIYRNTTARDWLTQEGFRFSDSITESGKNTDLISDIDLSKISKVESALDRHVRKKGSELSTQSSPNCEPQAQQNRKDDVDLLRASDVRASAGLRGRPLKEDLSQKQARQKSLEARFDRPPSVLEGKLAEELAQSAIRRREIASRPEARHSDTKDVAQAAREASRDDSRPPQSKREPTPECAPNYSILTSSHINAIRSKLVPLKQNIDRLSEDYTYLKKRILDEKHRIQEARRRNAATKAKQLLDQEVSKQKDAMLNMECHRSQKPRSNLLESAPPEDGIRGEGDVASNIHEFLNRPRWYKRKAPHAQCEMDAKFHRLAAEKALVREIRDIYEDAYGKIGTEHHQFSNSSIATRTEEAGSPQMTGSVPPGWMTQGVSPERQPNERRPTVELTSNSRAEAVENSPPAPNFEKKEATALELTKDLKSIFATAATLTGDELRAVLREGWYKMASLADLAQGNVSKPAKQLETGSQVSNALSTVSISNDTTNTADFSLYRILAYDSSAQKVNSAKFSSQHLMDETTLTPPQAFQTLSNPGKFLPHLTNLYNKGYDVVSGGNDILVLKKTRELVTSKEDYHHRPNPIDGTTTPEVSTGNFASPTGFVNHNPIIPPEEQQQEVGPVLPRSQGKMRREEEVFSAGENQRWQEKRRRSRNHRRRASRRSRIKWMLLTGTMTAAACYGVGVYLE